MKGACHKRIILRCVAKDNELCSANAVAVGRFFGRFFDYSAHHAHGVHIYTGFCRTYVDRRTYMVGKAERFGYAFNKRIIAGGKTFVHQSRVAADEVYPDRAGGPFKAQRKFNDI